MPTKNGEQISNAISFIQKPETILKLVVGIFALGIAWSSLNTKITNCCNKNLEQQAQIVVLQDDNKQFGLDMVEVKTKLTNIEALLVDLKKDLANK